MKAVVRALLLLTAAVSLSGCCPNGCFVVSGKAYRDLAFPTPNLFKWKKEGATEEDRYLASEECGGGRDPNSPFFSPSQIEAFRPPGESENQAYSRRFDEYQRCLIKKGYKFTGQCYDNETSRSLPACGAP